MEIDWLTVIAQIVNFLILVWLLKRFLYKPIVSAMDRREASIQARLDAAVQREQDAQAQIKHYEQVEAEFERERAALLQETQWQAAELRRGLQDEAQAEVTALRNRWLHELEAEQGEILAEITQQVVRQIGLAARIALADLADVDLETQVVATFLGQLDKLDGLDARKLATALAAEEAVVATGCSLSDTQRRDIQSALDRLCESGTRLRFEQKPSLICGLELTVAGRRLAWNMADYLKDLERDMATILLPHDQAT